MTSILLPDGATLAEMGFPVPQASAPVARSTRVQYHEEPPVSRDQVKRWQAELETVAPSFDQLASLYLRWEPGDIWQPVQRFVIWELIPNDATPPHIWEALKGAHPRSEGHYDLKQKRWVGGPRTATFIDRATWEVHQETGRWGIRFWVIQGAAGGHPINVPRCVQIVKKITGDPLATPPACGDLPYCTPGHRVFNRLAEYDRYRKWRMQTDWASRNFKDCEREELDEAEKAAAAVTVWWDAQVGAVLDEFDLSKVSDEVSGAARSGGIGTMNDETSALGVRDLFTQGE